MVELRGDRDQGIDVPEPPRGSHARRSDRSAPQPREQERLARAGETVRVYTPYGDEWYGYLMRRLAERPQNLSFFARSLISKK